MKIGSSPLEDKFGHINDQVKGCSDPGEYWMKFNCWEFKKCGREPGGSKVEEFGVCPAAIEEKTNGINSGKNGGRACWAISGTLCGGKVQGTYAAKEGNCLNCEFYQIVQKEERPDFKTTSHILKRLNE